MRAPGNCSVLIDIACLLKALMSPNDGEHQCTWIITCRGVVKIRKVKKAAASVLCARPIKAPSGSIVKHVEVCNNEVFTVHVLSLTWKSNWSIFSGIRLTPPPLSPDCSRHSVCAPPSCLVSDICLCWAACVSGVRRLDYWSLYIKWSASMKKINSISCHPIIWTETKRVRQELTSSLSL